MGRTCRAISRFCTSCSSTMTRVEAGSGCGRQRSAQHVVIVCESARPGLAPQPSTTTCLVRVRVRARARTRVRVRVRVSDSVRVRALTAAPRGGVGAPCRV